MTRFLILLELTLSNEGCHYSIEGVWRELTKRFGEEWKLDRQEFNAEVIVMLDEGLLEVRETGIVTMGKPGERLLKRSKLLTFIAERMIDFGKPKE